MLKLSFKQTQAEFMVRVASSLIFNKLVEAKFPIVAIRDVTENVQYGYTEKAAKEEIGPKYVRITDLQDGQINWETVPYCKCEQPEQYLLSENDLLFARTGATTGKTHLVRGNPPNAVFASYLIRVRPQKSINPEYLYSFFQSDLYWSQVSDKKEGSAQPNVNGQKLSNIQIPIVDKQLQTAINEFLSVVRLRQDGFDKELPELPAPLMEQRRIVARIEAMAARVAEAQSLRREASEEASLLIKSWVSYIFDYEFGDKLPKGWTWKSFSQVLEPSGMRTGPFGTALNKSEITDDGVPVFGIANVGNNKFLPGFTDFISFEKAEQLSSYQLQAGDIAVARSGTVGRSCVVPNGLYPEPVMSSNLIRIRINKEEFLPDLMCRILNGSKLVEHHKDKECRGSSRIFFTQKILNKFQLPVPPLEEQRRLVAYLDGLQVQVSALRAAQAETEKELSALLPSVLDRAFKGEL